MAEALACGTRVLALSRGSVPEVLQDGVTGFIRATEEELVNAVSGIVEIGRARCRAEAERRFSPSAMRSNYERAYGQAIEREGAMTALDTESDPAEAA